MLYLNDDVTCTGKGDVGTNKPRLLNTIVIKITKNASLIVRGNIMNDNYPCCTQNALLIRVKLNTGV